MTSSAARFHISGLAFGDFGFVLSIILHSLFNSFLRAASWRGSDHFYIFLETLLAMSGWGTKSVALGFS